LTHVIKGIEWFTDDMALWTAGIFSVACAILSRLHVKKRLKGKSKLPLHEQLELVEKIFTPLVVISSCSVAFAHGANDVANAVGPLAAVVNIVQTGAVKMKVGVPFWVMALGGGGIVFGLATFGYRVMQTVGVEITEITPSRGVAADIAATATVLVCTRMKLPVSTTHTLVGAILGIGLARGLSGINRNVTKKIFGSWLTTVPAAAGLSVVLFLLGKYFFLDTIRQIILLHGAQ